MGVWSAEAKLLPMHPQSCTRWTGQTAWRRVRSQVSRVLSVAASVSACVCSLRMLLLHTPSIVMCCGIWPAGFRVCGIATSRCCHLQFCVREDGVCVGQVSGGCLCKESMKQHHKAFSAQALSGWQVCQMVGSGVGCSILRRLTTRQRCGLYVCVCPRACVYFSLVLVCVSVCAPCTHWSCL
jgi:hypothetical protein